MENVNAIVSEKLFIPVAEGPIAPEVQAPEEAFSTSLGDAIEHVNNLQVEADIETSKIAHGEGNLHETALAFEQADISLRLSMKVRNKAVETYQEIMRMHV